MVADIAVTASTHMARVVCLGRDAELLYTRVQVLSKSFVAVGVGSLAELADLPATPAFDIVMLCHTLSPEDCRASEEIARCRWPGVKVVALLSGFSSAPCKTADALILSTQGPAMLLRSIDQLIGRSQSLGGSGAALSG